MAPFCEPHRASDTVFITPPRSCEDASGGKFQSPTPSTLRAFLFAPNWSMVGVQPFHELLMQWISPELVYPAMAAAQSARFEFGETP